LNAWNSKVTPFHLLVVVGIVLRILISGVALENLFHDVTADGSGFPRSQFTVVTLLQVNPQLVCDFVFHVVERSLAVGVIVACHLFFTSSLLIMADQPEYISRKFW